MTVLSHAVVIVGAGPTGLMLAGELALAGVDVAVVERRTGEDLAGSRAGGLHSRMTEALSRWFGTPGSTPRDIAGFNKPALASARYDPATHSA